MGHAHCSFLKSQCTTERLPCWARLPGPALSALAPKASVTLDLTAGMGWGSAISVVIEKKEKRKGLISVSSACLHESGQI